ncbi:hypothetical protein T05_3837 [Trichinella murrelli]|uniref:Uncharacterized protein n=1 Tax=Trichinella murrelli TaxID=144512 RepID=A0A0V0T7V4_9BILA|nr:hypothetical protein T05_3837 [Trichinella murrelli]
MDLHYKRSSSLNERFFNIFWSSEPESNQRPMYPTSYTTSDRTSSTNDSTRNMTSPRSRTRTYDAEGSALKYWIDQIDCKDFALDGRTQKPSAKQLKHWVVQHNSSSSRGNDT